MASVPVALALVATRPVCKRDAASPDSNPLVVDERGRVEDEASLGRVELPLRVTPFGEPEVRFLEINKIKKFNKNPREIDERPKHAFS